MTKKRRILIIGATSAIAQKCIRLWTHHASCDFVLIGRNAEKMRVISDDIKVRNALLTVKLITMDFFEPDQISGIIDQVMKEAPVDIALVAHGCLLDQTECETNLSLCRESLMTNFVSPALFVEACAKHFEHQKYGTLAIIGSVAGDRGRKSNYIYGSAKSGLEGLAQGLRHRFSRSEVRIVLIKPGPTDTPMTAHLKSKGVKLENVSSVAKQIVSGISRGDAIIYAPSKWKLIMWIIRLLPSNIFNRLNI